MVTYNIDDKYCHCGNKWIRVKSSLLFGDYYYCEKCDKIFTPTVEEKTKQWFDRNYNTDRRAELINLARITKARAMVTNADLKKLGYL
jgi:hypothetical protein